MSEKSLASHEIVTLALFARGGERQPVDLEDIAVEANAMAPGKFNWRKYPDQINIENIRVFLTDAAKEKNGAYVTGDKKRGWILTPAGKAFAQDNQSRVESLATRKPISAQDERRIRSEWARVVATPAVQKFVAGDTAAISSNEADAVFRINEYLEEKMRQKKVSRIVNILGSDEEVGEAVRYLAKIALREQAG